MQQVNETCVSWRTCYSTSDPVTPSPGGISEMSTTNLIVIYGSVGIAILILFVNLLLAWLICCRKRGRSTAEKKPTAKPEKLDDYLDEDFAKFPPTYSEAGCDCAVTPVMLVVAKHGIKSNDEGAEKKSNDFVFTFQFDALPCSSLHTLSSQTFSSTENKIGSLYFNEHLNFIWDFVNMRNTQLSQKAYFYI